MRRFFVTRAQDRPRLGSVWRRRTPAEFAEYFWSLVDKSEGGCWEWRGIRHKKGYGEICVSGRHHKKKAHRVSWELASGPVPPGIHVLHRCDNPPCVRPDHLFLGTNHANVLDAAEKGRRCHGEATWTAKLDAGRVREIRRGYLSGALNTVEIARLYGISTRQASAIVRRESWKHVE